MSPDLFITLNVFLVQNTLYILLIATIGSSLVYNMLPAQHPWLYGIGGPGLQWLRFVMRSLAQTFFGLLIILGLSTLLEITYMIILLQPSFTLGTNV